MPTRILQTLVIALLVVAGCGGDDTDELRSGEPTAASDGPAPSGRPAPGDAIDEDRNEPPSLTRTTTDIGDLRFDRVQRIGDHGLITLPGADGRMPEGARVRCRAGRPFPASGLHVPRSVIDASPEGVRSEVEWWLATGEAGGSVIEDWWILEATDDRYFVVEVRASDHPMGAGVSTMTIERMDGEWKWAGFSGGGACPLQTVPRDNDVGPAEWEIDIATLSPASTELRFFVSGLMCSGGEPVGDRLVGPDVVITNDAVFVAFGERRLPDGEYTCQGVPSQEVTVELPEPLGDRHVRDGLYVLGELADFVG